MGRKSRNRRRNGVQEKTTIDKLPVNSTTKVDLYTRMTNSFMKTPMVITDSDSDSDDETVEFQFKPRRVFVNNLCSICMLPSKLLCENCKMVTYCSDQHKSEDTRKHEEFCKFLSEVCTESFPIAKHLRPDQYREFRVQLIGIMENAIKRRLELWEREVLLYPRICNECWNFSDQLHLCSTCNVDLCCRHLEEEHNKWCNDLSVFNKILALQQKHGYVNPQLPRSLESDCCILPKNFDSLLRRLYDNSNYYKDMDCYTYSTLTQMTTNPLTVLFALQNSIPNWRIIDSLVIHIVGAEFQFECSSLQVWERVFLHLLPNLRKLNLVFVGPELCLPKVPIELLSKVRLCGECRKSNRSVKVEFQAGKVYHDFATSQDSGCVDLICLFNPGLYRSTGFAGQDTWLETIRVINKSKAIVVATAYTEYEMPKDIERIRSVGDIEMFVEPQKNPFASVRPDRNFVSDESTPLIYKNGFLSVFKGK